MRDRILFVCTGAFLFGVFLRSWLVIPSWVLYVCIGFSFLLACVYLFQKQYIFLILALSFFLFSVGVFRFHHKAAHEPRHIFDDVVGQSIDVTGIIVNDPDRRESSQRFVVRFDDIRILVSTELYPEFSYGDEVTVSGKLSLPRNFVTDTGRDFDYVGYLMKDSIFYTISFAKVSLVSSGHGQWLKDSLLSVKHTFLRIIEKNIQSPQSALLGGLLLGTKQSLGESLEEDFIKTGLIHIVVLSGYNVTIIAESLMRALSFLSLRVSTFLGVLSIICFALMTGGGATIVRASIMAILALVARVTGNAYAISRALLVAAFFMVLHNPYILYFDISFQLSFLATLGLIYGSPLFEKYFMWLPEKFGLRSIASATIATQLFVLPFLLYKIGTLSLIAPITNLLILPLVPTTMLFGFFTGLSGLVSGVVAAPFAFITNILLWIEITLVKFFAGLSFSAIVIRQFPFLLMILLYVLLGFYVYKKYKAKTYEISS